MNFSAVPKEEYTRYQQQLDSIFEYIKSNKSPSKIYDNSSLMKLLNVSQRTLASWRENGTIKFSKVQGKIFYRQKDIDEMLDQSQQNSNL